MPNDEDFFSSFVLDLSSAMSAAAFKLCDPLDGDGPLSSSELALATILAAKLTAIRFSAIAKSIGCSVPKRVDAALEALTRAQLEEHEGRTSE